ERLMSHYGSRSNAEFPQRTFARFIVTTSRQQSMATGSRLGRCRHHIGWIDDDDSLVTLKVRRVECPQSADAMERHSSNQTGIVRVLAHDLVRSHQSLPFDKKDRGIVKQRE